MNQYIFVFLLSTLFLFNGCLLPFKKEFEPEMITSMNIIDRNGMSETISSKDRLSTFDKTNFLTPQPYQKVLRVYGRKKNGNIHSYLTSYHPNGQPKQYLEAINNRAYGSYQEWFPNGQMKIDAKVIGGIADLDTSAEQSWLFEGLNRVWNEEGILIAQIPYNKGELEGEVIYYHDNSLVWKITPYDKGFLQGTQKIYLDNGRLFQTIDYNHGEKEGEAIRYWNNGEQAYHEQYKKDLLMEGDYLNPCGSKISEIRKGEGWRAVFGKESLQELQEFQNGIQEGAIHVFDEEEKLIRIYHLENGLKQGEEVDYFPNTNQTKLLLTWHCGVLQGPVKTWYENGQNESQREMSGNRKNGLLTAWYRNGNLMLVEEYSNDKLIKGEYYRLGENIPLSKVEKGHGTATLFNPEGIFLNKIDYQDGIPVN
ncbi:MAG: hypothetical protein R3E91_03440 [Chlamydiales bacterium]